MVTVDETKTFASIKLPDDLGIRMLNGFCPAGLHVVMHIGSRSLIKATLPSDPTERLSNALVFSSLAFALTTWVHPQIHIAAEKSAREIAQKPFELDPVRESSSYVHETLLLLNIVSNKQSLKTIKLSITKID